MAPPRLFSLASARKALRGLDTTGDGKVDSVAMDTTGDGCADTIISASGIDISGLGDGTGAASRLFHSKPKV